MSLLAAALSELAVAEEFCGDSGDANVDHQRAKFDELSVPCRITYWVKFRLKRHVSIIRHVWEMGSKRKKLGVRRID